MLIPHWFFLHTKNEFLGEATKWMCQANFNTDEFEISCCCCILLLNGNVHIDDYKKRWKNSNRRTDRGTEIERDRKKSFFAFNRLHNAQTFDIRDAPFLTTPFFIIYSLFPLIQATWNKTNWIRFIIIYSFFTHFERMFWEESRAEKRSFISITVPFHTKNITFSKCQWSSCSRFKFCGEEIL